MDTVEEMKQRLATLNPERLEIIDESARHAGHAGAKSGGHYQLTMVASAFAGLGLVARHRAIYQALGDLMEGRVHALAITAKAPGES